MKERMSRPQQSEGSPRTEQQRPTAPELSAFMSEGELCLDVINSERFDYRGRVGPQDDLEQPEWVQAFAQHWHLPITSPPGAFELAALRALRTLLRQMYAATASEQPVIDAQIEELNSFLSLTPVMQQARRVDGELRLQTVPLQTGWNGIATQAAASWVDLQARTPPSRLKICANPDCHWVFVDQSHNLSRRWCRQWACGNLMKVRQFRAQRARPE